MHRHLATLVALVALTATLTACSKGRDSSTTVATGSDATNVDAKASGAKADGDGPATSAPEGDGGKADKSVAADVTAKNLPIYPGVKETNKISVAGGGTAGSSMDMHEYHSDDTSKVIADWYKDRLGSKWGNISSDTDKGYVATYTLTGDDGNSEVVTVAADPKGKGTIISLTVTGK
ncbi:MAG: hypothetical protein PVSMB8_16660 [Vulcanimicrobiaceae bacterium]